MKTTLGIVTDVRTANTQDDNAEAVHSSAWVERAKLVLEKRGPMKIRPLAAEVGGGCSPRSLSMFLQWEQGKNHTVKYDCGRWARSTASDQPQRPRE